MDHGFPTLVEWEMTRRCQLECIHCSQRAQSRGPDLDDDEAMRLARDLVRGGCCHVSLSGGEPTLRRGWMRIATVLAEGGVNVAVISNGLGFDAQVAREARRAGVGLVLLSLDGTAGTHDRIRGREGAHTSVLRAAEAIRDAGLMVGFMTTLLADNASDLGDMARTVNDLGVNAWIVSLGIPTGTRDLWFEPAHMPAMIARLRLLARECPALVVGDGLAHVPGAGLMRTTGPGRTSARVGCQAGRSVMGIQSDGLVRGCLSLPASCNVGNLLEHDLRDLHAKSAALARWRSEGIARQCSECRLDGTCPGPCHAAAMSPYGVSHCLDERTSTTAVRRAASVAATVALASGLACGSGAGCGSGTAASEPGHPPAVVDETETPARAAVEGGVREQDREAAPAAEPDAPGIASNDLPTLTLGQECVCVSDAKDADGQPVGETPCMCISHMYCSVSGAWMCPEGTTMQFR